MKVQGPERDINTVGIYIHIPFCKQACHYCNYHFSTSLKKKADMINAICEELHLRKNELEGTVKTIYFGGGTPSILSSEELQQIFDAIYANYTISENPEITLEANPDDILSVRAQSRTIFEDFKTLGINRLSIGVQSFFEEDLILMNRAHNASEALDCIKVAKKYFDNITIDLIYGIPGMSKERWVENLNIAMELQVPHLSCYVLTVEPKTALKKFIEQGKVAPIDEDVAQQHHEILLEVTENAGYDNYEFSNFGKPGFRSHNNTAYWEGKSYLGIGPSAHSYDGNHRSWNVENNTKYIKGIEAGELPSEKETLSKEDKYNEYIMIGLRTEKGISLRNVEEEFGVEFLEYIMEQAFKPLREGHLIIDDRILRVARKSRFLSDGIASDLFWI